jgi:hypothetical protein
MQETPIYQGFLQFSDTYISICIVPFNADFIEMQWRSPWNLTIPPRGTGDHFIACETPPWVSHFLGQGWPLHPVIREDAGLRPCQKLF